MPRPTGVPIDLPKRLARNIRTQRKARGLSQEQFGAIIGMHRTRVGKLEQGHGNLTLSSLARLARVLGCEPLDLLR